MRGVTLLLLAWLCLVGCICISCTTNDAPHTSQTTGTGDNVANTNTGSGGAAGSAPCSAVGTKTQGNVGNPAGSSSSCDTTTTNPPLAEDVQQALGLKKAWVTQ